MDSDTSRRQKVRASREDAITRRSPDGRPAHPEFGRRALLLAITVRVLLIVIAAGAAAILIGLPIALAVLGVGTVLIAVDPTVWSAVERARERQEVVQEVEEERK